MAQALGDGELGRRDGRARPTTCARCARTWPGTGGEQVRGDAAARLRRGDRRAGGDRRPGRPARPARPGASRAPRWTTSTSRRSSATWAAAPPTTYAGCGSWSASCAGRAGSPGPRDGLTLSPKALRRLGGTALRTVFADLHGGRAGASTTCATPARPARSPARPGPGSSATSSRWTWSARCPGRCAAAGAGVPVAARRSRTSRWWRPSGGRRRAVALCVDLSFSMVLRGPLGPDEADRAGPVAPGRDPVPAGRAADHRLRPVPRRRCRRPSWPRSSRTWSKGTNLQHALRLAGRHLRRHSGAEPVVLVVTDGEPTAHIDRRRRGVLRLAADAGDDRGDRASRWTS